MSEGHLSKCTWLRQYDAALNVVAQIFCWKIKLYPIKKDNEVKGF